MTLLYAYNFDEASGNILDASGNGRDTVLGGSLTRTAAGGGHLGGSDKGMSQSTTAADSNGPSITGLQTAEFTVMCWVKRSSNSTDGWIAELKASGSGDRGILFLSGAVQARARNSGGTVANQSTTQPTAGSWYHVAASYSTTDSKVHLYINGVESGTGAALTGPLKTTSATSSLFDGCGSETVIDDVRYYDTARSAAQITTDMNTPVTSGGTAMTLNAAAGTGAAQAMTFSKDLTLSAAGGTGAAQALAPAKAWTLGAAAGSGTPAVLADSKAWTLGAAAGSGAAQALIPGKAWGLQNATGSGVAQAATFTAAGFLTLDTAAGVGTAQPMAFSKAWTLGTAAGAGAPQALTPAKAWTLGAAAGTGSPRPWAAVKQLALAAVTGTGAAQSMTLAGPLAPYVAPEHWTAATRPYAQTAGSRPAPGVSGQGSAPTVRTRRTPHTAITREQP